MDTRTERITYSVKEAARALGVGEWMVREKARTGRIRTIRLGARILIPRQELERLVNQPKSTDDEVNINDIEPESTTGA